MSEYVPQETLQMSLESDRAWCVFTALSPSIKTALKIRKSFLLFTESGFPNKNVN